MIAAGMDASGKSTALSSAMAPALLEAVRADRPDQSSSIRHDVHGDGEGSADRITLSVEGILKASAGSESGLDPSPGREGAPEMEHRDEKPARTSEAGGSGREMSRDEQVELGELKQRDAAVRAHENAHMQALGPYRTGGATFQYETGPDGRRYAVAGEVPVDVSAEGTPEETIRKAQTVRRAALAPADPSSADRGVASDAARLEREARAEIAREERAGREEKPVKSGSPMGAESYNQQSPRPTLSVSV